jgi:hypothetical protein
MLPKPTVTFVTNQGPTGGQWKEADIRGMLSNPIAAGIPPFPALVDDEKWVAAAKLMIKEEGAEQFLVNMLYLLRRTYEGLECEPRTK